MIGAVIAMQSEADVLLNEMKISRTLTVSGKTIYVGTAFDKDVSVCVCGVGKVNAALGAQLLVSKFDAKKLFNMGVAGGVNGLEDPSAVEDLQTTTTPIKIVEDGHVYILRNGKRYNILGVYAQ